MLMDMGMNVMLEVSGSTSTLLGALFLGMSDCAEGTELDAEGVKKMFAGGLANVKQQTSAQVGDKTMVDALAPAVEALERNSGKSFLEMLKAAEIAAKQGVENTKKYQAKFGRAKSLMERAVGYQDAGATSVWLIFQGMIEFVDG